MSQPIRVLFFIGSLKTGGSEAHVVRLLSGLDRGKVSPGLMCLQAQGLDRVSLDKGVDVHVVNLEPGLAGRARGWKRMIAALRAVRPDVLHTFGYTCNAYGPILGLGREIKVVTTRRSLEPNASKRRVYRWSNRLTTRVLCNSIAGRQFAVKTEGLAAGKTRVIPNGVPIDPSSRGQRDRKMTTIGSVGRVHSDKGTDLLIDAFTRLPESGQRLVIAGPVYNAWGRALAERYAGDPRIEFRGDVADVPGFLREIDLFALTSPSEGMSMALLEAMAAGLPIVATNVGGNPEVLDRGSAGLLVPFDAAEIAKAIASIVGDPASAARLGRAARDRVRSEYAEDVMLRRYEREYEDLLGR